MARAVLWPVAMLRHLELIEPYAPNDARSGEQDALRALAAEFAHLRVDRYASAPASPAVAVLASAWRAPNMRFDAFDRAFVRDDAPAVLRITGERVASCAVEVLTRYQRYAPRRNAASATVAFDEVLARHRALHDLRKPLVAADYDHALDVWQWVLRLDPAASCALQIAALFHDVERLVTEADVRIEQHAADYEAFKYAHARAGAAMAKEAIANAVGEEVAEQVHALVASHERPEGDPELATLNDADALSFFALNSGGFLDYYGAAHTAKKVAYTLARMRPGARARLRFVRLRPDVARVVHGVAAAPQERERGRPTDA